MRTALSTLLMTVSVTMAIHPISAADEHVYGTFVLFEMNESWAAQSETDKRKGLQEAQQVVDSFEERVNLDVYWTYGLTSASHFMVRLHASEARFSQELLTALASTGLGRHLRLTFTITGVTKALNYAPEFPDLYEKLEAAQYQGPPPVYVIMIPTRKDAAWWNLAKDQRSAMMREHMEPTLDHLKTVKRKLYHTTGLADADFITYFETNSLVDFNNLVISLRKVREDRHNVRLGEPTVLGTIKSFEEVLGLLENS